MSLERRAIVAILSSPDIDVPERDFIDGPYLHELSLAEGQPSRVCLQSWMGTYVCAEESDLLVANRARPEDWETFELISLNADDDLVALRAHNKKYLSAKHHLKSVDGTPSVIMAIGEEIGDWEKFKIDIDLSGLIALRTHDGTYISAEPTGLMMGVRRDISKTETERFRFISRAVAELTVTRIDVNVYKIVAAPFWHTGTVIDDVEFYYDTNNRVRKTFPKGMKLKYHRTIVRHVPGDLERVRAVLNVVRERWNGTRYDVASHNCNWFTNDLMRALGTTGLDREYIDASGVALVARTVFGPGWEQEVWLKWPLKDKRLDKAALSDLERLGSLAENVRREIVNLGDKVQRKWKKIWGL